jgi:F0F1-type ATP synthase delta subunit
MKFSSKKLGKALATLVLEKGTDTTSLVKGVAELLVKTGKTSKLGDLIKAFKTSYNKKTGTIDVEVTASSKDAVPSFKAFENVSVREHIDPSLIGGLKVLIDDVEIDTSIKSKLQTLKTIAR